ncbi:DUF1134 domain-containing protein [Methylosinus sp. Ce-a6]|uniref:DUF1134 domain-containing protein n=1 Tax=Methylosinus sp. Ce-a6 TaxID=2172005 RepID=UPI00135AF9BA|nr:DUF1134 domain-containing protein [Methylosinus sp. Ce-a6]
MRAAHPIPRQMLATRREMLALASAAVLSPLTPARAAYGERPEQRPEPMSGDEVVRSGHRFFGAIARDLAQGVEQLARRWGRPNAYVLGQEGSGAFIGGLRYGEGVMYTRNAGQRRVYWQGPSLGFDAGADGDRTMMLIYNLPSVDAIYTRFGGVAGSAYLVGGLGFTELTADGVVIAPIRAGLGARLGVNLGYLKFTPEATWNPF